MLYITTRNKFDTYTVHKANQSDRGPDGGLYLPFRMPELTKEQIKAFAQQPFCQRVADLLNQFFGTQLTAWDVELYGGKNTVKQLNLFLVSDTSLPTTVDIPSFQYPKVLESIWRQFKQLWDTVVSL